MIGWIKGFVLSYLHLRLQGKMLGGLRRQGLLVYFKAVNGIRRLMVVAAAIAVVLQVMTLGLVGLIVTASFLFIHDADVRLYVLLGTFGVMFILPFVAISVLLSERFWLRLSGAQSLIQDRS